MDDYGFMDSWPQWVRWLCVLPAAFAGVVVAEIAAFVIALFSSEDTGGPGQMRMFWELAMSAIFIFSGTSAAPKYKEGVGVLLSAVPIGLAVWLWQSSATLPPERADAGHYMAIALCIGVVAAWGIMLYGILKRHAEKAA